MSRAVGNKSGVAWSLRIQGDTLAAHGDAPQAEASLRESLGLYRELGQKPDAAQVIESLANVAHLQGQHEHAALLWGAADALRQAIHAPRAPGLQLDYERSLADTRARLGDAAFDAKFAEGRALTLDQAFELALGASVA
jgi:tetratricopeptide (TPR) repeat protein